MNHQIFTNILFAMISMSELMVFARATQMKVQFGDVRVGIYALSDARFPASLLQNRKYSQNPL